MRSEWSIQEDVIYLNHGSFGPSPKFVQKAQQKWSAQLESEPMEFFVRQMELHLEEASAQLGRFIGADGKDLIFMDNATYGMNIVAESIDLNPDEEVLITDHEYGAVLRIWQRKCKSDHSRFL